MNLKIIELEERSAKFVLEKTNPSFANALRRALIADIPKMAIEDVEFHLGPIRDEDGTEYESITPLFDEIIAHRLGLIPIPTDLDLFVRRDECKDCEGEGCPNCTIMYSLNKKGPCTVYSGDFEPLGGDAFKPVDENIPIVKLGEGQAMLVYATATLGTGREHAKWQVAHGVGYKYYPVVEIKHKDGVCDFCEAVVESCPKKLFSIENGKLIVKDVEECTLCMSCVEMSEGRCVHVEGDPTRIIFSFETDGSMTAAKTLETALKILRGRFLDLSEKISKLK